MSIIGQGIADATCPLQLFAGLVGCCEVRLQTCNTCHIDTLLKYLHGKVFYQLMPTTPLINALYRQAALHNIGVLCPPLATCITPQYELSSQVITVKLLLKESFGYGYECTGSHTLNLGSNTLKFTMCCMQTMYLAQGHVMI